MKPVKVNDGFRHPGPPLKRRPTKFEIADHYRAPLTIPTPQGSAEELERWHGAPPSRPVIPRREGGPFTF